jgi:hypothetical protein
MVIDCDGVYKHHPRASFHSDGEAFMGALRWEINSEHRLTILHLAGDLPGAIVRERIEEFWHTNPESLSNHCIVDMRDYIGDFGYDDLAVIAKNWRKFARGRDAGLGTAIVTNDRFARLLMTVVSRLFHARKFALFADAEEARRWIATI